MSALAERRIIPHDELKSRAERKAGVEEQPSQDQPQAEPRLEHLRIIEALLFAAAEPLDETP